MLGAQYRDRAITAAVVDENTFVRDRKAVEDRIQAREQAGERELLVVYGYDDTE